MPYEHMGSWSSTNKRNVTNDVDGVLVLFLVILVLIATAASAIFKIDYERTNQEILIEQGLLKTGPYWNGK